MPTAAPLQALCVRAFARRLPALPTGARALLYADGASARALAACAGLQGLASALRLSAASLAVLDLATARATDAPWSPLDGAADEAPCFHVLIVVSSLLTDAHGAIVRCCRCHGARCASVHVLASLSEGAHASAPSCPLGAGGMALAEYETGLRADLAGSVPEGVPVDVRHAPLPAAPLAPAAFTSPRGGAAERLPVDRQASDAQSAPASSSISSPYLPVADDGAELDDEALPHALPVVAHELAALAAQVLRARSVEAFGVGKAARAVARALAPAAAALVSADDGDNADASEAAEASDATSKVAVVVVDRTCDLAAALTHGDSFTGRAVAALAPPPQAPLARGAAAALPSAAARAAEGAAAFERAAARQDDVAAGADATSTPALLLAEELLGRRGRDGAMACRKAMMEALKAAGVPKPAASRGGGASSRSDELRALADALDGAPSPSAQRAHARVAALGRCAAALLQEGATAAWDAAASAERVVTHALAEPSTESVEAVLEDALKAAAAAPSQPMGVGDVLALAALVVLLKQRAHKELGRSLADSLGAALAAEPGAAEQSDAPDAAAAMGARVREWLSDLARLSSAQLGRDEGAGGEVAPAPLLARLCAAALQRAEPALGSGVRLYKAPAGLGGALVSGLTGMASALRGGGGLTSALGAALAPTAGQERRIDADVVVVYVLGGVTPLELREAKDAAKQAEAQWQRAGSGAAGKPPRLIVGGSRLLTPEGLMSQLWQLS